MLKTAFRKREGKWVNKKGRGKIEREIFPFWQQKEIKTMKQGHS